MYSNEAAVPVTCQDQGLSRAWPRGSKEGLGLTLLCLGWGGPVGRPNKSPAILMGLLEQIKPLLGGPEHLVLDPELGLPESEG